MCFGSSDDTPAPQRPPEQLDQAAPEKKTANQTDTASLAIGTKKYRNNNGLGISTTATPKPSGYPTVA